MCFDSPLRPTRCHKHPQRQHKALMHTHIGAPNVFWAREARRRNSSCCVSSLSYLVFHQSRHGQVVEQLGEAVPHRGVSVLAKAFVVEPVHLGDLAGLVVAPQNGYAVFEPDLGKRGKRGQVVCFLRVCRCHRHPPQQSGQKAPEAQAVVPTKTTRCQHERAAAGAPVPAARAAAAAAATATAATSGNTTTAAGAGAAQATATTTERQRRQQQH